MPAEGNENTNNSIPLWFEGDSCSFHRFGVHCAANQTRLYWEGEDMKTVNAICVCSVIISTTVQAQGFKPGLSPEQTRPADPWNLLEQRLKDRPGPIGKVIDDALWVKRTPTATHLQGGYDIPYSITVDQTGNIYVTGMSDGGTGTLLDYATIKYNPSGEELWVARYDGPGHASDRALSLAVDGSGNVYVTGESAWSIEYPQNWDYLTIKYNSSGDEEWVARYDGAEGEDDFAEMLRVDDSGNVYVTGSSVGSTSSAREYTTIKYNSSGEEEWVARYDGPGSGENIAYALAVDDSGNVYVTGSSCCSGPDWDYATVKYSPSGEELWVARYDGPGNDWDWARSIAVDTSGNVYVTGESPKSSEWDSYDYTTIKYSPSGEEVWVARYDGAEGIQDFARVVRVDDSGNAYVTGNSWEDETSLLHHDQVHPFWRGGMGGPLFRGYRQLPGSRCR